MKIPVLCEKFGPDGGPCTGMNGQGWVYRYFRWPLYCTLLHLKPKNILEIGTNLGQTASLISKYLKEHQPDGHLITVDVAKYCEINEPNTSQILVHPHIPDIESHHDIPSGESVLPYTPQSANANIKIIRQEMSIKNISEFDFCFADGNHESESLYADLTICRALTKEPCFVLIDDTEDYKYSGCQAYQNDIKHNVSYYDYSDWSEFAGFALTWNKTNREATGVD